MEERLQKLISAAGLCSRRTAEEWIAAGRVTVNGVPAAVGGKADLSRDRVEVDGAPLSAPAGHTYIMLYKPRGYVTTLSDEQGRPTVAELTADCPARVWPVGRLDMDSEGLLLFTNDGAFANRLMHPKHEVQKTYLVQVSGYTQEHFRQLAQPITLDGYRIHPPVLRLLAEKGDKCNFEITIHEGRNRQIRRMCEAAGMQVLRLRRIREGAVTLGELPLGKWRHLTQEEVEKISGE